MLLTTTKNTEAKERHRHDARFQHFRRPLATHAPRDWQPWLYDQGSLTKRLIALSCNHFSVRVLRNAWGIPERHEQRLLGLKCRQRAIIREVQLLGKDKVWVLARSIIPTQTLRGKQRKLHNIGNRPLGKLLFSHNNMRRGLIEVATIHGIHNRWARRSLFYLDGRPLLVTEIFTQSLLSQ